VTCEIEVPNPRPRNNDPPLNGQSGWIIQCLSERSGGFRTEMKQNRGLMAALMEIAEHMAPMCHCLYNKDLKDVRR